MRENVFEFILRSPNFGSPSLAIRGEKSGDLEFFVSNGKLSKIFLQFILKPFQFSNWVHVAESIYLAYISTAFSSYSEEAAFHKLTSAAGIGRQGTDAGFVYSP